MAATSALLNAPNKVIIPATIQTLINKMGEPNWEAINAGFIKMPDPMIPPITRAMVVFNDKLLLSCHDVSGGGLAIALAECCFGEKQQFGATLEVSEYEGRKDGLLFAETGARFIVSCSPKNASKVKKTLEEQGRQNPGIEDQS